jgi:asparagine synthase (glutamine-hydrolysing)
MAASTPSGSLVAAAGPHFSGPAVGSRRPGRIGGCVGPVPRPPSALRALEAALGPGATLLRQSPEGPGPDLVCDSDGARLDGEPLSALGHDRLASLARRLAAISGAFAAAWWDEQGGLNLARDPIGERSLFYAETGGGLAFASALRPLLEADLVGRELDLAGLGRYLSWAYVPGQRTLLEGIRELLPGQRLRFRDGRVELARYWDLPGEPVEAEVDEAALRAELRTALELAVSERLPASGGACAALLSGGLDSSLVVALARRLHRGPLVAYSISFGGGHANELAFSAQVARHCGIEQRVVELRPDVVVHHLEDAMGVLNDPIGDPLTVPNAILFREVAQESGVALNGEGGDPCFGGPKNLPMLLAQLFGDGGRGESPERSYLRAHHKCYDDLEAMLEPEVAAALLEEPLEADVSPFLDDARWPRFVTKLMAMNVALKGPHHILQKVECESFPFGVLPRSPLFDRRVVELAFRIPARLKLRGSTEKYLLKRAVEDLLPGDVVERPKSGMLVPIEQWFRGPLAGEARTRLLDGLARRGLIRRSYLEDLLAGRLGGLRPRYGAKLWLLLALEAWLSAVVDRPAPAPPEPAR